MGEATKAGNPIAVAAGEKPVALAIAGAFLYLRQERNGKELDQTYCCLPFTTSTIAPATAK